MCCRQVCQRQHERDRLSLLQASPPETPCDVSALVQVAFSELHCAAASSQACTQLHAALSGVPLRQLLVLCSVSASMQNDICARKRMAVKPQPPCCCRASLLPAADGTTSKAPSAATPVFQLFWGLDRQVASMVAVACAPLLLKAAAALAQGCVPPPAQRLAGSDLSAFGLHGTPHLTGTRCRSCPLQRRQRQARTSPSPTVRLTQQHVLTLARMAQLDAVCLSAQVHVCCFIVVHVTACMQTVRSMTVRCTTVWCMTAYRSFALSRLLAFTQSL